MTKRTPTAAPAGGPTSSLLDRPYLLLVLAPLFWGGNMTAGRLAVGELDPLAMSVWRWTGAILVVLPFALGQLRRDWPEIRRALPWLVLFGALGFAVFNALIYGASHFTSGINIAMEQALIPVMVMVGNFIVFSVRARRLQVLGVVLTIIGVLIVATHGDLTRILALDVNLGDAMVLGACLCYAIYSLSLRNKPDIGWMSFILVCALAALATSLVLLLVFGGGPGQLLPRLTAVTPAGWGIVVYIAIFPSIVSQLCYARGVELIGPNRASIFINLLPVFGAVLAILVLGERLGLFHAVAAVFIVGGIVLAEFAIRRREAVA